MSSRLILIGHNTQETDDRASAWAAQQGFARDWVFPHEGEPVPELADATGVIVYGGRFDVEPKETSPFLRDEARLIEEALKADRPVLGLCLGAQIMADVLGARVCNHPEGYVEYGYYPLNISNEGRAVFGDELMVLESHWQGWFEVPSGAVYLAGTEMYPQQAFRYGQNGYAFQFHPETTRETLAAWISRRPPERHKMPGSQSAQQQLDGYDKYHPALAAWFDKFLDQWMSADKRNLAAAE